MTGSRIKSVLGDITTVVKTRYTSGSSEAFAKASSAERHPVEIGGEDLATVLLRFENGARGSLKVGQVLPGHKNDLQLEINGREASLRWDQEQQNELWIGKARPGERDALQRSFTPAVGRLHLMLICRRVIRRVGRDAFRNVVADAYGFIQDGGDLSKRPKTPVHLCGRVPYLVRDRCDTSQPPCRGSLAGCGAGLVVSGGGLAL